MRFLFIIQGEGRGHFTQALALQQILQQKGDTLCAVLVGKSSHRQLPAFFTTKIDAPVYTFESPNFLPTPQNKRPSLLKSLFFNLGKLPEFQKSIKFIHRKICDLQPDLVINFYELLTGLTYLFKSPPYPLICIGHQYLFLHKDFQFPPASRLELFFLRFFSRITAIGAVQKFALSFYDFPQDPRHQITVIPPLLRKEIFDFAPVSRDFLLGYLLNSGYVSEITQWQAQHPVTPLHFFWDQKEAPRQLEINSHFHLHKIDDTLFLQYMVNCKAYATTAGFESVCEALYLQKPVLMVPVHIEQKCNAWDAQNVGAGISASRFDLDNLLNFIPLYRPNPVFKRWAQSAPSRIYPLLEASRLKPKSPPIKFAYVLAKFSDYSPK